MIRITVRTDDAGMAANVGGSVFSEYRSFEVAAPELEQFLVAELSIYAHRQIISHEIIAQQSAGKGAIHDPKGQHYAGEKP